MKYLFTIVFALYWTTYLFPFANGSSALRIEWVIWGQILGHQPLPPKMASVWSFHFLANVIILAIALFRLPAIALWLRRVLDQVFLDRLLLVFLWLIVGCPFFMERITWNWGALCWSMTAVVLSLVHIAIPPTLPKLPSKGLFLEQHLVPLEEDVPEH